VRESTKIKGCVSFRYDVVGCFLSFGVVSIL